MSRLSFAALLRSGYRGRFLALLLFVIPFVLVCVLVGLLLSAGR